jgi:hypothetical protein
MLVAAALSFGSATRIPAFVCNPSVAKAKAVVREARATLQQTAAGLLPSVSGTASVSDNKASAGSSSVIVDSAPYTLHQASFDSSGELDLFEATLISSIGGIAGIIVALLLGAVINLLMQGFQVSYSPFSIASAFSTSTGIGIGFGYFPAR